MSPTRFLLPTILLAVPVLHAQVSQDMADKIVTEGKQNSKVSEHLDHLTNVIGHRLTGSDNFTAATQWAVEEFKKMGLTAHLEEWDEWDYVWNRGQWQGRVTAPVAMELHVATPAWTGGTRGLVRGEVVPLPETIDESLAGKWVMGQSGLGRRSGEAMSQLVAVGVAGYLYPSSGDENFPNRIRVFGSYPATAAQRALVQVCIRQDQFKNLMTLLETGEPVEAEFDIRNRFRDEKVTLHNVIADIRGTEKPDEMVIVCGHLDSWHQATGATDNGTGSTSAMEAARILATVGAKPKRTIRFILWGGEEQGLLGSRQYVVRHRSDMEKISILFNHDSGTNFASSLNVMPAQLPIMQSVFEPILALTTPDSEYPDAFNLRGTARIRVGGGGGGTDSASFAAVGVPAYSWSLSGKANYFGRTWHSQWDTFDAMIPEYQAHTATVIALAALGSANLPELLTREGITRPGPRPDAAPIVEGRLGVRLNGMSIARIRSGGAAAGAGLQVGDQIVDINGKQVKTSVEVNAAMRDNQAPWLFGVLRGGERVEIRVTDG